MGCSYSFTFLFSSLYNVTFPGFSAILSDIVSRGLGMLGCLPECAITFFSCTHTARMAASKSLFPLKVN